MRIRITFSVQNRGGLVPFHHQYLISNELNRLLSQANGPQEKYPFFSFSGLKGQTQVSKRGLHFHSRKVTIVLSSASAEFMEHLVDLILGEDSLTIGKLIIEPQVAEEEQPVNLDRETKYVCISPILITDKVNEDEATQFVDPFSDDFSDWLYESTINRMTAYGIDVSKVPDLQKFQVIPDKSYMEKLKANHKKFARVYPMYLNDDKVEVRGYTFPFTLYAAREVQDFIFTCGLGSFTANGFGMLDLANSNPIERTVLFREKAELVKA